MNRTIASPLIVSTVTASLFAAATHPCPVEADIWVLAGQSNMEGAGLYTQPVEPDPRIWMFNMDNTWMTAQIPIHRKFEAAAPVHKAIFFTQDTTFDDQKWEQTRLQSRKTPLGGVGPGFFFARHLAAHIDRNIALIPSAHGGTSMDQWDPKRLSEGDDSLYGAMINRIKRVGGRIKGILWYQGESETWGEAEKGYQQKMLDFIDAVRRDTGLPDLPIIMVQIGRYVFNTPDAAANQAWQAVRDIQRRLPDMRPSVWLVPSADLELDDMIHISSGGQERLGRRLAETALTCVYQKEGRARPIGFKSARWVEGQAGRGAIKVEFSGVTGALRAAGRPAEFKLIVPVPQTQDAQAMEVFTYTVVHRVECRANDPSSVILHLPIPRPSTPGLRLLYGEGCNPYVNLVDAQDMAVPCFGPVAID